MRGRNRSIVFSLHHPRAQLRTLVLLEDSKVAVVAMTLGTEAMAAVSTRMCRRTKVSVLAEGARPGHSEIVPRPGPTQFCFLSALFFDGPVPLTARCRNFFDGPVPWNDSAGHSAAPPDGEWEGTWLDEGAGMGHARGLARQNRSPSALPAMP